MLLHTIAYLSHYYIFLVCIIVCIYIYDIQYIYIYIQTVIAYHCIYFTLFYIPSVYYSVYIYIYTYIIYVMLLHTIAYLSHYIWCPVLNPPMPRLWTASGCFWFLNLAPCLSTAVAIQSPGCRWCRPKDGGTTAASAWNSQLQTLGSGCVSHHCRWSMLHFMAIPLQSYLNLLLTQHIPTLLSLTLPFLLLHATAIIFCASAQKYQKCILIWPQLVKVVSDEANRSTCGRTRTDSNFGWWKMCQKRCLKRRDRWECRKPSSHHTLPAAEATQHG